MNKVKAGSDPVLLLLLLLPVKPPRGAVDREFAIYIESAAAVGGGGGGRAGGGGVGGSGRLLLTPLRASERPLNIL